MNSTIYIKNYMSKHHLAWGEKQYPINWSNNPYIWSDVYVIIEAIRSTSAGSGGFTKWQKENPIKKKRLIKLLVTIDDIKYKEEHYVNDDAILTIQDIQLLEKKIITPLGIKIDMKNQE